MGLAIAFGLTVDNSIVVLENIYRYHRMGLPAAIAAERRTREAVMRVISATLFTPDADARIWNAIGYAMIGGLSSSTILVRTVTPALYLLFERGPERRRLSRQAPIPTN